MHNDFPKGGFIGALLGALISVKVHKKDDSLIRKASKTGVSAGIGFAIGTFIEKIITKSKK